MSVLRSVVAAFACFSAIPMPHVEWDQRDMRYMMAAFPLVGVAIGLLFVLWQRVCATLGAGQILRGAGFALIPMAVTGGIHMDGLADVADALSSHAEPRRKREILKDPHVGAFAVMGVSCYVLASFALACELDARWTPLLACSPVVSRALAGIAAVSARLASSKGMLASVSGTARAGVVRAVLSATLLLAGGAMLCVQAGLGALALVCAVLTLVWVVRMATREFGGMSGDLSGFYVQMAELAMLAAVVFAGRLV